MLALRDQENLVHANQAAAAAKPLNQGNRQLHPKTPAATKTPFQNARNDENRPIDFDALQTRGKAFDGKAASNAFVTPLAPRTRAPLGAKTTNAKAGAFKTPAPQQQKANPQKTLQRPSTGRRSAKSKITVLPSQPVDTDILSKDVEVLDCEYAPPPIVELADPPMEFDYDQNMPQFEPQNMFRGQYEWYGSPKDENGISLRLKEEQEAGRRFDALAKRALLKQLELIPEYLEPDRQVEAMIAAGPKTAVPETRPSTIKARSAATLLSQSAIASRATQGTASTLQKRKGPTQHTALTKATPQSSNPSPMRHTAANLASKSTIGFPRAAKPPSILTKHNRASKDPSTATSKADQNSIDPERFVKLYGDPPVDSEMWFRLQEKRRLRRQVDEDDADPLVDDLFTMDSLALNDDDDEDFQLSI